MREITKSEFKEIYFRFGSVGSGWDKVYWDTFFEVDATPPWKYMYQPAETSDHTRMMIVSDHAIREFRLFFFTVDEEENFFR